MQGRKESSAARRKTNNNEWLGVRVCLCNGIHINRCWLVVCWLCGSEKAAIKSGIISFLLLSGAAFAFPFVQCGTFWRFIEITIYYFLLDTRNDEWSCGVLCGGVKVQENAVPMILRFCFMAGFLFCLGFIYYMCDVCGAYVSSVNLGVFVLSWD